jgi:Permuted papain-like amidase enzyme, YaeF/YiiX, C92 family
VLLHYGGIRGKIRDGDILLFRGKSWISRLICRVTGSPYSHAAIVAWWSDRLMVLEAVGKGIVVSRMSVVVNQYSGKVELWTTDDKLARTEVIRAAQRLLGKRYSLSKLVRNLARLVFGRPRHDDADPDAPPADFVCSEFVSRVWRAGGIDLVKDAPDLYTKPSDIAKSPRLRKIGGVVRGQPAELTGDSLDRAPVSAAGAR